MRRVWLAAWMVGVGSTGVACGRLGFETKGDPDARVDPLGPDAGVGLVLPAGTSEVTLVDAVADASGRAIAVGTIGDAGVTDFVVVRFVASGGPDLGFGVGGFVVLDLGSGRDQALGVALDAQGRIVVVGETSRDGTRDSAVVRLLDDGALDASFDDDGTKIMALAPPSNPAPPDVTTAEIDRATAVAIDASGRIVIAGEIVLDSGQGDDLAVIRLLDDGTPDPEFGTAGVSVVDATAGNGGASESAAFVRLTADGKIVLGGSSTFNLVMVQLDANGSLDPMFGGDGDQFVDMERTIDRVLDGEIEGLPGALPDGVADGLSRLAYASHRYLRIADVALDAIGRMVVVGSAVRSSLQGGRSELLVARYLPDGNVDEDFCGGTGACRIDVGGDAIGRAVHVAGDGTIAVAGLAHDGARWQTLWARLDAAGTPDTTFAPNGWRLYGYVPSSHEVAALVDTPGGLAIVGTAAGAPFLAHVGTAATLTPAGEVAVTTSLPFLPASGAEPDLAFADGDLPPSSADAPLAGNSIMISGNARPARGTATAVFLRGNDVVFADGARVAADGEDGLPPGGLSGAGGEGGNGGGAGAFPFAGRAGVGGTFGRDGGGMVGIAVPGGRGWAAQYNDGRYWGQGGGGGYGGGCCPKFVAAGQGSNGGGGGGGGSWSNRPAAGGGGGGGLVVIVAETLTGAGVVRARGGGGDDDANGTSSGGGGGGVVWIAARRHDGRLVADVAGGVGNAIEFGRAGTARLFQILADDSLVERRFGDAW